MFISIRKKYIVMSQKRCLFPESSSIQLREDAVQEND